MKSIVSLTAWQKRQAALLYHFSSLEYLTGLRDRVDAIAAFAGCLLDQSRVEGRDRVIRSARWGNGNTGENWAINGWRFLADFRSSIARDIADRAAKIYHVTGRNQCARGMAEFSMQWSTPAEQQRFDEKFEELSRYARYIDQTMNKTGRESRWNDFGLTTAWQRNSNDFRILPKFSVLIDVAAESGQVPPRTGVYLSVDDPNAALQFAWTGNSSGRLLDCATLNNLGNAALASVGRSKLWVDGKAMLDFLQANLFDAELRSDPFFDESQNEDLAPSLVARNAFTSHPSRWNFVELLNDEFEPLEIETEHNSQQNLRYESGTVCQNRGWYFTPARQESRRCFEAGEVFPDMNSKYGKTIWQWDVKQT